MRKIHIIFILSVVFLLPGCAAVPFGIGLIPGAPAYISSVIGNGQTAYTTAMDERTTQQQMLDAIIAGHAQAELYKHKDIEPRLISAHAYFGKLYLVGEYESQAQLKTIYECVEKVEGKKAVISQLYLKKDMAASDFLEEQATAAEIEAQLLADYQVTSSSLTVEVVQGDIILLGVISDKEERDRIIAHAQSAAENNRVIPHLYHQEIAGPKPRVMSAKLATQPKKSAPAPKPVVKKRKIKQKPKPLVVKAKEPARQEPQSIAENRPKPPEVIHGRVLGL